MMTKESVAEMLSALSGMYGAGSFGYLPQLFGAKWLADNKTAPEHQYFAEQYPEAFGSGDLEKIAAVVFCSAPLCVVTYKRSAGEPPFSEEDSEVSAMPRGKIISYTKNTLATLDFAETAVPRSVLLAGFNQYLEESIRDAGLELSVSAGAVENIIAGIAGEVQTAYDPFCKFGALLSAITAKSKIASDEFPVYSSICAVRTMLAGDTSVFVARGRPIERPLVSETGDLRTFSLVVSDITNCDSEKVSTAFQLDMYRRFQRLCPGINSFGESAAFCHALASTAHNGRCILLTDNRYFGRFATDAYPAATYLITKDLIEAVIDVALPQDSFARRRSRCMFAAPRRRIFVISPGKSVEKRGRILFINAAENVADDNVARRVISSVQGFTEEPGFAKIMEVKDIISHHDICLDPAQHTAYLEKPRDEDLTRIARDLTLIEEQRTLVLKRIESATDRLVCLRREM